MFRVGQTYDGVDDGDDINAVLAPLGGELSFGNTVGVEGNLTTLSPIVIDGGELWAETFTNIEAVVLRKGVLGMTGTSGLNSATVLIIGLRSGSTLWE